MKIFPLILISFVLTLGATMFADDKERQDDWIRVNVKGTDKWFTLAQLKNKADAYLQKGHPKIDISKFVVTANLETDNPTALVKFEYYQNFGLFVYYVSVNGYGDLVAMTNMIASEKLDISGPKRD